MTDDETLAAPADNNGAPQRKVLLRRYADTHYEPPFTYGPDEDMTTGYRRRWWHIVGALLLIAVMLIEVLLPVVQGLLELTRFVPSNLGEPL